MLQHVLKFILLAVCVLLSQGLKDGDQYYIQLDMKNLCGNTASYIGFSNLTCISSLNKKNEARKNPGPVLVSGPINQTPSAAQRQWMLSVKQRLADGTYLAIISNYSPLSKSGKPRCEGSISLARARECKSGKYSDRVFINEKKDEIWRIIPLEGSSSTFSIVSKKREPGCLRYLGANKDCTDHFLKLYTDFDGSGLQRWKFIPVGVKQQDNEPNVPPVPLRSPPAVPKSPPLPPPLLPQSPPPPPPAVSVLPPGKPTNVIALPTVTSSVAIISWVDGSSTAETYEVRCVAAFSGCSGVLRGTAQQGIARGVQRGIVNGLSYRNELQYSCYVVARNQAGVVCSDPVTLTAADAPTNIVSTFPSQYTWLANWNVGAAGTPEEVYSLQCVQRGAGCDSRPLTTSDLVIERWKRQGSLTMPPNTAMDCYIVAENSAARVCSAPQPITSARRALTSAAD